MSNYRAIAAVTKVLEQALQVAAHEAVNGAQVRTRRPEAPPGGGQVEPGIDLYLYQVMSNGALRNIDVETRRADGTLAERPRIGLNLHYLLTFRGDEARLEPQRILGNAVRVLHAAPVLRRQQIQTVVENPALDYLNGSDLADAPDLVKLTPLSLSLEELSKLWSVFFQIPYNLSLAYEATVVVIEGDEVPRTPLPVADRRAYVVPLAGAVIDEVVSSTGGPLGVGGTLVVRGRNLRRDVTRLSVSGVPIEPSLVTATEVRALMASPPFPPDALRAGVHGVTVVHPMLMGVPPVEHTGFQSNVAAFVLRPRVTGASAPSAGHVDVTLEPVVRKGQRVVLLLNGVTGATPPAHSFTNRPAAADAAVVGFTIAGVAPGQYFVRVQVDGAESPVDLVPGSPSFGPTVVVPP